MKITLATHYGMCFGVKDALRKTQEVAAAGPVTILGQLVHNPLVREDLRQRGVVEGELSSVGNVATEAVVITAHGASDQDRNAWRKAGHRVTDTTCPLVKKAHSALAQLVAAGCHPVIIGQAQHVEVRGLAGDFPHASIVETLDDLAALPPAKIFGVVSQTTQPVEKVRALVEALRARRTDAEVVFRDTVCQPTKDRQEALEALCREHEVIVVIGGRNSNNTRQLSLTAGRHGARVYQIERAEELQAGWFSGVESVGVTAGTSTLEMTVQAVVAALRRDFSAATGAPDRQVS